MKFDDLHEKFLTLSKAVSILDKENKVAAIMEKKDAGNFDSGIANEEVRISHLGINNRYAVFLRLNIALLRRETTQRSIPNQTRLPRPPRWCLGRRRR